MSNQRKNNNKIVSLAVIVAMLIMLMAPITAHGAGKTVARVGNKNYTSLQAAVSAVKKGGTVKLMRNVKLKSDLEFKRSGTFTLNLNRHQISGSDRDAIKISKGSIKIKNGTIVSPIRVSNKAKLTIQSGTYKRKSNEGGNILLDCYDEGRLIIKGGTFNGVCSADGNAKVWIKGGTFSCTHWYADAFNIKGKVVATVSGGVFKGSFSSSGNTTIKNGTFKNGIANSDGGKMIIYKATVKGTVCNHHGTLRIKGGTYSYKGVKHDSSTSGTDHTTLFMLGGKTIIEGGKFTNTYNSVIGMNVSYSKPNDYPKLTIKGGTIKTNCPYCTPIVSTSEIRDKIKISINWGKVFPGMKKEEIIRYF